MSLLKESNIKVEKEERKDPTSFLPEEEMSYEIKKKKKKKKRKEQEDPFKDIEEKSIISREPDITALDPDLCDLGTLFDPEVTIKVENIEVDLNVDDIYDNELPSGNLREEPEVKLEDQNRDAVLLTFHSVISENVITDQILYGEKIQPFPGTHYCDVCHLVFKTAKSLDTHQKRQHKHFRRHFKHVCDICGMSYEFKNSMVAHIRRKHGPGASTDDKIERTCEVCSLVFKGSSRLRMHMQRKHGTYEDLFTHKCKYCGLTYDKECSLVAHIKKKHTYKKEKPKPDEFYKCPFCERMFNKRETYTRHVQRRHSVKEDDVKTKMAEEEFAKSHKNERTGELTCNQCQLSFSSVGYLKWHMRRIHNAMIPDFRLKCRICNMSYAKAESLKRHVRRKHGTGTYCQECNRNFESMEAFLNHTHSKDVQECTICGLIFGSKGGLAKHLRCTHKIEDVKTVFCSICNAGFHHKRQLKPHYNRVHLEVSYPCKFCQKTFKRRESYRRHVLFKHQTNTNIEEKTHQCDKCPEKFKDEFELCTHNNTVHGEVIPVKKEEDIVKGTYKCTKCSDEYSNWELLRVHFEQVHHMTEEVQCQVCGDMMSRGELIKHMKLHDEIEVKCRFCDFKCKDRVSMSSHMLRHKNANTIQCQYPNCKYKTFFEDAMLKHTKKHEDIGVKMQCASCPFQTMNKYLLRYHEEAHATGKKRYQCDQCSYATTLPACLVQHKYKHATVKRFKCQVCPFATKYNTSLRFHVRKKHCDLPIINKEEV